jgi:colicin V production protein
VFLEIFAILIIALAGFMHFRSGIWSAVQTLWAALLAGAVAFGFFIPLSKALFPPGDLLIETKQYWGDALMLLLLFVVTFSGVRLVAEHLLRNEMKFKPLVDTIGGAALGAASGYIIAGMLAVFAQMMPLPPDSVLGYKPFELATGARADRMATRADESVLGLYNAVLGGSLAGGDGNLASHYPSSTPSAVTGEAARGSTVDDILHYYFRRRLQYAIAICDDLRSFKGSKRNGVSLDAGSTETYAPRGGGEVRMTVHGVRKMPYRAWRKGLTETSSDAEWQLQWPMTDGQAVKVSRRDEQSCAVMLVDVSFTPLAGQAISLGDWSITHDLRSGARQSGDARSRKKRRTKTRSVAMPKAKLWGLGKVGAVDLGTASTVVPIGAVKGDEKEKAKAILPANVEIEAYRKNASLARGADAEYLASSAVWNFNAESPEARATLAFLVPAMSMPRQFGLKCGSVADVSEMSKKQNPDGLYKGRKLEAEPLKFSIKAVSWMPSHAAVKTVGKNNELVVLDLEISKAGKEAMRFSADDLTLHNTTIKKDYSAWLIEPVAVEEGTPTVKRSVRYADIHVTDGETVMADGGATGHRASEEWEIFFVAGKSGKATVQVAFEIPRGRRADSYRFGVPEDLEGDAPEWYLMRNVKPVASRTHLVDIEDSMSAKSIKIDVNGTIREIQASTAGGQEILVIVISVTPKSSDDKNYYEIKPAEVSLKASRGPRAGRDIPLFACRPEGDKAFRRRPKASDTILIRGERELEFAYYVPRQREALQFLLKGFKTLKLLED